MAIEVKFWIGSNGEILKPLSQTPENDSVMVSKKGVVFFPITETVATGTVGSPMGLLLAITYPT